MAQRMKAYETWKLRFDALNQLAAIEQDLMRLGYLTPSRAHYQRAVHRLPLPPCSTCGAPAIGRFPDGSALYRHNHPSGTEPYVIHEQTSSMQMSSSVYPRKW